MILILLTLFIKLLNAQVDEPLALYTINDYNNATSCAAFKVTTMSNMSLVSHSSDCVNDEFTLVFTTRFYEPVTTLELLSGEKVCLVLNALPEGFPQVLRNNAYTLALSADCTDALELIIDKNFNGILLKSKRGTFLRMLRLEGVNYYTAIKLTVVDDYSLVSNPSIQFASVTRIQ
jgi:hypothetical protein